MKLLLSLIIFFSFFISSQSSVYASDLEVICNDSLCMLPSHDPLFSPSESWVPGDSSSKDVLIKNVSSGTKEIFIKVTGDTTDESLDNHIFIILENEAGSTIWDGSFREFLDQGILPIAAVGKNDEFKLTIKALFETGARNELQGKSSKFDFGFGFEGQTTTPGESSNNDKSTSSTDTTNGTKTSQSILSSLASSVQITFSSFQSVLGGEDLQDSVLAASDTADLTPKLSTESGAACTTDNRWPVIIVLESFILFALSSRIFGRQKMISFLLTAGISGIGIFMLVCFKWLALTAILPVLISLLKRKSSQK